MYRKVTDTKAVESKISEGKLKRLRKGLLVLSAHYLPRLHAAAAPPSMSATIWNGSLYMKASSRHIMHCRDGKVCSAGP